MKVFYKKLSIILVMAFTIMLGRFSNVLAVDDGVIGTSNLNNTTENSAKKGDVLLSPEKGWKRYDDRDSRISFDSNWFSDPADAGSSLSGNYNKTSLVSNVLNSKYTFRFYGTKLRLIGAFHNQHSNNVKVIIDGAEYTYSEHLDQSTVKRSAIIYEKPDLSLGTHTVVVKNMVSAYASLDAIDIDSTGYLIDLTEISLDKTSMNLIVGEIGNLITKITPDNATNKKVNWISSNKDIATVDGTGKVTAVKEGTATITATIDGTNLSDSCTVTVTSQTPPVTQGIVLNVEPEKNKIHLNETVTANLTIDNIKDIAAEDVRIKYDNSKLQFLGVDEVEGMKLVKQPDSQPGELRFIVASKGEKNIVNDKKALLKLKFKGIVKGEALVDVTKGRVSDGLEMEKDLTDEQCGKATIIIDENALKDVNNSGEFTLLDLGIDARHMGKDPKAAELAKYNTDIVSNNAIDEADLLEIGKFMLENPNYKF